jgi:hypothetical protein
VESQRLVPGKLEKDHPYLNKPLCVLTVCTCLSASDLSSAGRIDCVW